LIFQPTIVDYLIIVVYFIFVIFIGFLVRKGVKTSKDFFLAGRSNPSWISGLAFISANMGALERAREI
jgi:SSS family solute:Na+ symporter